MTPEEYLNAPGVIELVKKLITILSGSGGGLPSRQYWLNWHPVLEPDEWNPDYYMNLYCSPYLGEIDPLLGAPTEEQFEAARLICNQADLIQGLGLLSILNMESPEDLYYTRVIIPLNVLGGELSFSYDPIHGRAFLLSLYNPSGDPEEFELGELGLLAMLLIPKIIVTIWSKEIIGTPIPLYPVDLSPWLPEEEEEEPEGGQSSQVSPGKQPQGSGRKDMLTVLQEPGMLAKVHNLSEQLFGRLRQNGQAVIPKDTAKLDEGDFLNG